MGSVERVVAKPRLNPYVNKQRTIYYAYVLRSSARVMKNKTFQEIIQLFLGTCGICRQSGEKMISLNK
jgi:hypothetical protein